MDLIIIIRQTYPACSSLQTLTVDMEHISTLKVLAFRTIFQCVLRKWKFNLPTAFFVMSYLDGIIPEGIIEDMFHLIEARNGQITQIIHLFSYDPTTLAECLNNMARIRPHIWFSRRPLQFVRTRLMTYLFSDSLKSASSNILPYINCCKPDFILGEVKHTIVLKFDNIKFENDKYLLNHMRMRKIVFHFPKNFDLPNFIPSLYTSLKLARESGIQPQPMFIDDAFHFKPSNKSTLFMSYTHKCPSCYNATFRYNCITQKRRNRTFIKSKKIRKKICECIFCTNLKYRNIKFP